MTTRARYTAARKVVWHRMRRVSAVLVWWAAAMTAPAPAPAQAPAYGPLPAKKLLEYGWDVPYPDQVLATIRQMEARPFDGVIFRLREFNHAFDTRVWPRARLELQLAQLDSIRWDRFTDNFLCLYAANRSGMDWFDDEDWRTIEANVRTTAAAARRGGLKGIVFDPEPYGPNPWRLAEVAPGRDFAATAAVVRQRGAQFMNALQAEMPAVRVLSLYQLSVVAGLFDVASPEQLVTELAGHAYGLLPAFIDGMLDVIGPEALLIDGNEPSYYYEDEAPYAEAYVALAQAAQRLVSPANRATYRRQVQVGMAIYVDQVLGLRSQAFVADYLTPAQRLAFLEHNVYWSLTRADEYAWIYSERMDWWQGTFPAGADAAVAAARDKVAARLPLGFDLDTVLTAAAQRLEADLEARVERRQATVPRRPAGVPAPVIDGHADEEVWAVATALAPWQAPAARAPALTAMTTAKVLWDETALYVAVDCAEPEPERMVRAGARRDDSIWAGDDVELLVGTGEGGQYVHFIVNPDNLQWDGRSSPQGDDVSWNADWQSATATTDRGWTVELRVPWTALGDAPEPGEARRVNLCRARAGNDELSCWSGVLRLFLEPQRFGTWVLAP